MGKRFGRCPSCGHKDFDVCKCSYEQAVQAVANRELEKAAKKPAPSTEGCYASINFTHAEIRTMLEAMNAYIHVEKNCSGSGPANRFYTLQLKLEKFIDG